jgi:opacity protein-like surface antigen
MNRRLLILVMTLGLAVTAARAGVYVGAGVGQSTLQSNGLGSVSLDLNDTATGWKAFAGFSFLHYLGVEASYVHFGTISNQSSGLEVDTDATGWGAFAVAKIPIVFFEPFVKVGYVNLHSTIDFHLPQGAGSDSETSWELAYGGGFAFNFATFVELRAEYEQYDISPSYAGIEPDSKLYMISASVAVRF